MKIKKETDSLTEFVNAPYGMDRIETDGGTVFYRNKNGIFDKTGKKVMVSMAQLRRFEANEKQQENNNPEDQSREGRGRPSGE